jgi:outer membrane protein
MPTNVLKLLTVFIVMSLGSQGQVVFRSIADVWNYADTHNISIKLARADYKKSVIGTQQSYGSLLPQISASAAVTDNTLLATTLVPATLKGGKDGTYLPLQFGTKYVNNAALTGQMDIVNLQTWMGIKIAKASQQLSLDSVASMRTNVYKQLASQYCSVILMKEAAALSAQSAAIADSLLVSVENKFREGLSNGAATDLAKINAERAKQTKITSEFQAEIAVNNIKKLLDMSVQDAIVIADSLDAYHDAVADGQFAEDDSIKVAAQQYNLSELQYRNANLAFLPTLSLSYNNSTQQNTADLAYFSSGQQAWYPASFWNLKLSWLLFNGGSRYFQSSKAAINREEKKMVYENLQKQVAINDANLRLSYNKAAVLLCSSKEVMRLSMSNYMHVSNRFQTGVATIEDRLNAFSDYINYQNQYLNNLSDFLIQTYLVKIRQQSFK